MFSVSLLEKIIPRSRKREKITSRRFESWRGGNLARSASGAHVSKKRIETITFGVTFFYFLTK